MCILLWLFVGAHVMLMIHVCHHYGREYHSGVVMAKREKQGELEMDDFPTRMEASQEQSTSADLAGFQSEHSAKSTAIRKGKSTCVCSSL